MCTLRTEMLKCNHFDTLAIVNARLSLMENAYLHTAHGTLTAMYARTNTRRARPVVYRAVGPSRAIERSEVIRCCVKQSSSGLSCSHTANTIQCAC